MCKPTTEMSRRIGVTKKGVPVCTNFLTIFHLDYAYTCNNYITYPEVRTKKLS